MTRWQRVVVTALAIIGVLALIGLFVWASVIWGPIPLMILTAAVFLGMVSFALFSLARFIYKNLPRKD